MFTHGPNRKPGRIISVENTNQACGDTSVQEEVCATDWYTSDGSYGANDPTGQPCPGEVSSTLKKGRHRLRGFYSSCRFRIVVSDVPGDDLGVIENFRDIVKMMKAAPGSQRITTAAMANPLTMEYSGGTARANEVGIPILGVYYRAAFQASLTIANQVQITTANISPFLSAYSEPNRDITIQLLEACTVWEAFLPLAQADVSSSLWAPRGGLIEAPGGGNNSQTVITGLTAGAGTMTVQFVTANSPILAGIWGVMQNPGAR